MFSTTDLPMSLYQTGSELSVNPPQPPDILLHEVLLLRQTCQQLLQQVDQLAKEKDHFYQQSQTFQLLYVQEKHDRARVARLLTTSQRELEHHKRVCQTANHQLNNSTRRRKAKHRKANATEGPTRPLSIATNNQVTSKLINHEESCDETSPKMLFTEHLHQQSTTEEQYLNVKTLDLMFDLKNSKRTSSEIHLESIGTGTRFQYQQSLEKCIEFSKSMLDVSVGPRSGNCKRAQSMVLTASYTKSVVSREVVRESIHNLEPEKQDKIVHIDEIEAPLGVQIEISPYTMSNSNSNKFNDKLKENENSEKLITNNEIKEPKEITKDNEIIENMNMVLMLNCIPNLTHCFREICLSNRPKTFQGIFFESALANGVVVKQVVPGSHAALAGIRSGDRVLEFCGINMRTANYRIADKLLRECDTEEIVIKIVSAECARSTPSLNRTSSSESNSTNTSDNSIAQAAKSDKVVQQESSKRLFRKRSTLVRREAFKKKDKEHVYFERKCHEQLMLYQSSRLTVTMPRRIHIGEPLEKIKLLGGNAVGIFVHSIIDQYLASILQTGDQLLEYNNFDLTKATAEDAAIELAKPVSNNSTLIALFNIDVYNQIQEQSIGDSFYIRTEFSRNSAGLTLEFKKGDILYIDNTLYNGKPGEYWRAWKVDEFGRKQACGVIPSKYNADCELLRHFTRSNEHKLFRPFWSFFRRFFSRNKSKGYVKLEEHGQVLASFSCTDIDGSNEENIETNRIRSYQMVRMIEPSQPRPVVIYGPYSHIVVERLTTKYPELFRACSKKTLSMMTMAQIEQGGTNREHQYIACTHSKDSYECISVASLQAIAHQQCHPVVSVVANTLHEFYNCQVYPIVIQLTFRSAKHIKETVNRWNIKQMRVPFKTARAVYCHMLRLETEFENETNVAVSGNNLNFMCTQIKQHVLEEQNKVFWDEA